ncbi:MAG: efflux RND transporter periplasmic adaptor subunit, partial [Gammaproteobacteria bacterium]
YEQEAATRENYDAVVARARAAQASVKQAASAAEQARVVLGDNVLRAPFAGVVSERLKEPGDMGLPNDAVVILQKQDELRFEAAIPAGCAHRLELGMPATIRTDTPARIWQGNISEIVPEIDQQTRSQLIKVDLPFAKGLEHGQFGWLVMSCDEPQETLFIPASAVLHYGQLEAVRIVEHGQVYTRHIRTGKQQNGRVEILSGLREGETILTDGGLSQ